ncbi:MAG: DNA polymerase III subunit delta' [Elainellaceae cyanobacterium]
MNQTRTPAHMNHVADLFSAISGQPQATELLTQALAHRRIAPAYLFVGPSGIGKRLTAQRFALSLLTLPKHVPEGTTEWSIDADNLRQVTQRSHPDLLWVEPTYLHQGQRFTVAEAEDAGLKRRSPPQIRLEQVRELTRFLSRPPLKASRSVVVIDGAETMAEAAANALLKTLEEPGNATLVLISHNSDLLLSTLISRCQRIPFQRLSLEAMALVLQQTGGEELLKRRDLLALAQGSPGQAIAALKQWNDLPEEIIAAVAQPPATVRQALTIARDVAALEVEAQLWLATYLQQQYYDTESDPGHQWSANGDRLQTLERARQQIQRFVQPRLVWEVAFMTLAGAL